MSNAAGTCMVSEQGAKMGRRSLLHVHVRGKNGTNGIEVGGYVTPVVTATMSLASVGGRS
jgi:predicted PhzF superfamily epimerase YddE/YHI9